MSVDRHALRRPFASYRGAPLPARAFVAARYVVAPMAPLARELSRMSGPVLSLGSGLSMLERYLAEVAPGLSFEGVDLDPVKVALIEQTRHLSPRVSLRLGDATKLDFSDEEPYDGVLVCDALHHFPADRHADVAQAVANALRPGGVLVVKDLDSAPAWKYHWNRIHDRIVAGPEPIWCRPPAAMAAMIESAGMVVDRADRIDHKFTPYAHYLSRAHEPLE